MYSLIFLFFPSFISIYIETKLLGKKYSVDSIISYFNYCLLNNLIIVLIFTIFFDQFYDILNKINKYGGVAVKYGVISIILGIVLGIIIAIIKNNVGFSAALSDLFIRKA